MRGERREVRGERVYDTLLLMSVYIGGDGGGGGILIYI